MSRFTYRAPSAAAVRQRATQQGGAFDSPILDGFQQFSPKEGNHRIRVLPALYDSAEHFGIDVYLHSSIGADNQTYVCTEKTPCCNNTPCPICEEVRELERTGQTEAAKEIKPYKRVMIWLINRLQEDAGPLLWMMPWTFDKNLMTLCVDKQSGEIFCIDDFNEGYDVEFTRTGTKLNTKYEGVAIARRSTPLHVDVGQMDAWLQYVSDNPLPSVLRIYDSDHIRAIMSAQAPAEQPAAQQTMPQTRQSVRATPQIEEAPPEEVPAEEVAVEGEQPPFEDDPNAPLDAPAEVAPEANPPVPARSAVRPTAPVARPVAPSSTPRTTPTTAPGVRSAATSQHQPSSASTSAVRPAARPSTPVPATTPSARPSPAPAGIQRPQPTAAPSAASAPTARPAARPQINPAAVKSQVRTSLNRPTQ